MSNKRRNMDTNQEPDYDNRGKKPRLTNAPHRSKEHTLESLNTIVKVRDFFATNGNLGFFGKCTVRMGNTDFDYFDEAQRIVANQFALDK